MTPQEEGRLLQTVEVLANEVKRLSDTVEALVAQQNYWKGGITVLGIVAGSIGAGIATMVSWLKS